MKRDNSSAGISMNNISVDENIKVVAITGGKNVPSRRYRINALIPFLTKRNIELTELCPIFSTYPPSFRLLRLPWFALTLLERLTFIYRSRGFDAVILQREMISTMPTLERLLPRPRVLDVDDAIYLHRNGCAAEYIARSCSLVVCGNHYLAEKFSHWHPNVVVIPTGVDTEKLRPIVNRNSTESPIIGWIGTAGNYRYLKMIEPALSQVLASFPNVRLQIIADQFPAFLEHLGEQLDFSLWKPNIENDLLPRFTIGIMPLMDNEWARGKCAFKMLQYMAAGIPVVASPVGMNAEIFATSSVGLPAQNSDEWLKSLTMLLQDQEIAKHMGKNGRQLVEKEFSLSVVCSKWKKALSEMLG